MKYSTMLRFINNSALETLKRSVKLTLAESPQFMKNVDDQKKALYDKVTQLNNWYTRIIGLDEVKLFQDRVTSLQEQLLTTQEKRRDVGRQLSDIRKKSLELQEQIHKIKRQDDLEGFLNLMKEETELLKLENSISATFQDYDRMERELFTAFSNAIRDSHEKQRAQIEYTKYFGLVLSIVGSFLAFTYSTIRKQDLKRFIEEKMSERDIKLDPLSKAIALEVRKEIVNIVADQESKKNVQLLENDHHEVEQKLSSANDLRIDYVKVGLGMLCLYCFVKLAGSG